MLAHLFRSTSAGRLRGAGFGTYGAPPGPRAKATSMATRTRRRGLKSSRSVVRACAALRSGSACMGCIAVSAADRGDSGRSPEPPAQRRSARCIMKRGVHRARGRAMSASAVCCGRHRAGAGEAVTGAARPKGSARRDADESSTPVATRGSALASACPGTPATDSATHRTANLARRPTRCAIRVIELIVTTDEGPSRQRRAARAAGGSPPGHRAGGTAPCAALLRSAAERPSSRGPPRPRATVSSSPTCS